MKRSLLDRIIGPTATDRWMFVAVFTFIGIAGYAIAKFVNAAVHVWSLSVAR